MSFGDSGALLAPGGVGCDDWPRYLTRNTIATITATTKTIMNIGITQPSQPAPWPQYPLPSHIISADHLSAYVDRSVGSMPIWGRVGVVAAAFASGAAATAATSRAATDPRRGQARPPRRPRHQPMLSILQEPPGPASTSRASSTWMRTPSPGITTSLPRSSATG